MDTNALKKFAQAARTQLIDQVSSKLAVVLDPASSARREHPEAMKALDGAIADQGKAQVFEQVAYTWFNRFVALRFMDANGYTLPRVVSPADGATRPEILAEAMAGNLPDKAPPAIAALLDGRVPSNDPQGEAYRLLLVHACNAWHEPMPFLFETIDDYSELLMPDDLLSPASILARLREVLTEEVCADVEVIGWIYQFYISEKKDQVFAGLKKNQKITAENIPAATQLFTPHWIVRYLVENSLGRLWLLNRPESKLAERMDYYIAPDEPETDFLKISKPEEIKVCDPACGSGHMLTYAFDLLYAIYEEEGYEADEIPALILTNNLTGIELDDRAGALAAFALAMKAAAHLGRRRFLRLRVHPKICVMQDVRFTAEDGRIVAEMVGRDLFTADLRATLGQFAQAKNFGSLIVPHLHDPAETAQVARLTDFGGDMLLRDVQERVLKLLEMAEALSPKYHVVVANPPYMGGKNMDPTLQSFAQSNFPDSKSDLFSMFIERSGALLVPKGLTAMITMQSWMFLSSYEKLRLKHIGANPIVSMAHIGTRGFDSIGGDVVSTTAFVLLKTPQNGIMGDFISLLAGRSEAEKSAILRSAVQVGCRSRFRATPSKFEAIPGYPIAYWASQPIITAFLEETPLGEIIKPRQGLATGNNDRFLRAWTELSINEIGFGLSERHAAAASGTRWFPYNKGGDWRKWYGNLEFVVNWENDGSEIRNFTDENGKVRSRPQNTEYYFKEGITWGDITTSSFAARYAPVGSIFDVKGSSGFPDPVQLYKCLALLNSRLMTEFMSILNPTSTFQVGDMARIPFVSSKKDVGGITDNSEKLTAITKSDWDAYETSWDFSTLPLVSSDHQGLTLADSYARLRAQWQGMATETKRLEEENNRFLIDAYGLQAELTSEVPLEAITLTCNPAYRYGGNAGAEDLEQRLRADTMQEFLHYAVGCMFGRYSLDAPGLILANQGEGLDEYLARVPNPTFEIDADNVIPVLDGEWFADDIAGRFRKFMRVTFGEAKFQENLAFIEAALGKDIRKWFTKDFFDYHARRFKKRPIYWMFSSPKGTFNALIYMHRYRPDTVSIVLNDYLREFISKLQAERARLEKLSDDPAASPAQRTRALKDVATVIKQIAELEEWEREVVFPLAQAKIEIDLDDGVKRNYPKFGAALKPIKGLETADE